MALQPKRLVRDSKGRLGITLEREKGASGGARKWGVMLLEGGTLVEDEAKLSEVGTVTQEDFLAAIDGNRQGRKKLAELFPEHVKTILGGG